MGGTQNSLEDLLIRKFEKFLVHLCEPQRSLKPTLHLLDRTKKGGSGISGIVSIEIL